jgi:hypothetical protein
MRHPRNDDAWHRLRVWLTGLRPGDIVTASEATDRTDLAPETVHIVLTALTRANLFERRGDAFVRRQLFDSLAPSNRNGSQGVD